MSAPAPIRGPGWRRRWWSPIVMTVTMAAAVLALASLSACSDDREAQTVEVVVPAGTQERLDAGEEVVVMASRIELRVGDTLLIRNDDSVTQAVGPYTVAAGEQVEFTYGTPGRYAGYCPLSEDDRYEIVVEE